MLFTSPVFLFWFLPCVIIIYFLLPHIKLKNLLLLISGLFFYAWGEPYFVFVMIFVSLVSYIASLIIQNIKQKKIRIFFVFIACAIQTAILIRFKYTDFIIQSVNSIFKTEFNLTYQVLPIGISFFTFQAMSYVFDVYFGEKAQKNPLNVILYISLFPQLIAGPIVRYSQIEKEITLRKTDLCDITYGVMRFMSGFIKKTLIANQMAIIADRAYNMPPADMSSAFAFLGAFSYFLQIYYDFSGYSDMATGLGLIFGFHFPENFNYPYVSSSITEFWRRWHMSLSSWFRDYVYIPLGGSRKGRKRLILNLFVVWLLTGIWHGAGFNYIVWGMYYFLLLLVEKFYVKPAKSNIGIFLRTVLTAFLVMTGWVFFRSENLNYAFEYLKAMFSFKDGIFSGHAGFYINEYLPFLLAGTVFSFPIYKKAEKYFEEKGGFFEFIYSLITGGTILYLFYVSVIYIIKGAYNPFIYFNF